MASKISISKYQHQNQNPTYPIPSQKNNFVSTANVFEFEEWGRTHKVIKTVSLELKLTHYSPNQSYELRKCIHRSQFFYSFNAFFAIVRAPSYVWLPPINPLIWTNTQPGIPDSFESSSSLKPRHWAGRGLRLSNLSGDTATACTRQCLLLSSWTSQHIRMRNNKTYSDSFDLF